ncbi:hypothetical protein [Nostoc sp. 'Peltigera membranacea cyanobiont' 232]|uniref:hypothetical protein n=1 Tax=Nostoc sp. 'Peltigera membranacea cyanobiont' 232 TaxID=2014531 RepID=UPI00167A55FE|nr:hypothetical protein [Nostoc sp. 'Peltigera membranacea cyanobiont' 232]
MQSSDAEESIKPIESKLYSIVLTEDENLAIVEGAVEGAIFTGTSEECQNEILMSLMLD